MPYVKYKVNFNGFAYVEADSEDEAIEKFNCGDDTYCEYETNAVEEADDFTDFLDSL